MSSEGRNIEIVRENRPIRPRRNDEDVQIVHELRSGTGFNETRGIGRDFTFIVQAAAAAAALQMQNFRGRGGRGRWKGINRRSINIERQRRSTIDDRRRDDGRWDNQRRLDQRRDDRRYDERRYDDRGRDERRRNVCRRDDCRCDECERERRGRDERRRDFEDDERRYGAQNFGRDEYRRNGDKFCRRDRHGPYRRF